MMKNTYLLTYSYRQGKLVKTGKMQIKNCDNELHAKIRLDDYLKRKIGDGVLEVSECEEHEDMVGYLRSIFGMK